MNGFFSNEWMLYSNFAQCHIQSKFSHNAILRTLNTNNPKDVVCFIIKNP